MDGPPPAVPATGRWSSSAPWWTPCVALSKSRTPWSSATRASAGRGRRERVERTRTFGRLPFRQLPGQEFEMATSETMNSALCPTSTPASYPVLAVSQPHLISSARTKPFTLRFLVVDRLRATLAQVGCDDGSEIIHPPPDGLERDHNPALGEQVFDIAEAEREPEVQPNRLVNDLRREPVARVADFLRIRCRRASLPCSSVSRATPYQRICRSDAVRRNRSPTGCAPW